MVRLGLCEVRFRAQPNPRIALVFLLCRQLLRLGCINHTSPSTTRLKPHPGFPIFREKMGVSWSSPRPTAATFLLGPLGFPFWVPAVRQKPRGLPLPTPCLTSPAWAPLTKAAWDQLLGKYQYQPVTNPRGPPEEEGKEELMAPA